LTSAAYRQQVSDAQAVVEGLVEAHEALVAAVVDPSWDYSRLVKAVNDFPDQASVLYAALTATSEAKSTTAK
jgi:hypothetical protein